MDLRELKKWPWPMIAVLALSVTVVGVYLLRFGGNNYGGTEEFGSFGDYIGGLLNPMVALCALYYLYRGVTIQSNELKETRAALEKTSQAQREQARLMKDNLIAQKRSERKKMLHQAMMTQLEFYMSYRLHLIKTYNANGHVPKMTSIQTTPDQLGELRAGKGEHNTQWHSEMEFVLDTIRRLSKQADQVRKTL